MVTNDMNNKFDALKTEDSGDDEGGENKAKDFESSPVKPGPGEHPLQFNYTFWFSRRTPGKQTSSQSYDQNLKKSRRLFIGGTVLDVLQSHAET